MKRRARPEQAFHITVAEHLTLILPPSVFWTSIDHAGGGAVVGAFRKARGVKAGLPDVWLVHRGLLHTIELKDEDGDLRKSQKQCRDDLQMGGCYRQAVCRNLAEIEGALAAWQIPTRGRIAA